MTWAGESTATQSGIMTYSSDGGPGVLIGDSVGHVLEWDGSEWISTNKSVIGALNSKIINASGITFGTTSTSYVNVTGASGTITPNSSAYIYAISIFDLESTFGGGETAQIRLRFNDSNDYISIPMSRDLNSANDVGIGGVQCLKGPFPSGVPVSVHLQVLSVGGQNVTVDGATLFLHVQEGAIGPSGVPGAAGATTIDDLTDVDTSTVAPVLEDSLVWNGSQWAPSGVTGGGAGSDTTAIHDNEAGEIAAITEKTVPVSADLLIIEDSAAGNVKKRVQIGNLPGGAGGQTDTVAGASGITNAGDNVDAILVPTYGTGANTICEGNDSRLSDDRTADGLRTATNVVSISGAAAPTTGQVLKATSTTTATWQTIAGGGGGSSKSTFTWSFNGRWPQGQSLTVDNARIVATSGTITGIKMWRGVAGSAGSGVIDVNINGTTIFTNQWKRPFVLAASGDNAIHSATPDVTLFLADDIFTIDVDESETVNPFNFSLVMEVEYA